MTLQEVSNWIRINIVEAKERKMFDVEKDILPLVTPERCAIPEVDQVLTLFGVPMTTRIWDEYVDRFLHCLVKQRCNARLITQLTDRDSFLPKCFIEFEVSDWSCENKTLQRQMQVVHVMNKKLRSLLMLIYLRGTKDLALSLNVLQIGELASIIADL